ncbi:unnamed protein product [Adineta steineri]|uniref:Uncharacterized protein n=1 Tax=Adineta steineri TaxID=433720 RepID=A0A816E525_9BILA|nr:unnamed protein product [Adineta steineri]CAF1645342.1 unnamed protein product [Adineta steineri]
MIVNDVFFDEKRNENLHTASFFYKSKQTTEFNELRNACQLLQFQVAQLTYVRKELDRPEVITGKEQLNSHLFPSENGRRRLTIGDDGITANSEYNIVESSYKRSSFIPTEMHQKPSVASSLIVNDTQVHHTNSNQLISKCPICYMIFPSNMSYHNRHQHINEHMIDDQDNNEWEEATNQIDKWCTENTEKITNHANQQKHLLNDAYNQQKLLFREQRNENLETANIYHTAKQDDLFNELLEACQSLKYQIATFRYPKYETVYLEVISTARDAARRRRRMKKIADDKVEINNDIKTSNSEQTNEQQSSKAESKTMSDKCPMCFMIFPISMTYDDRQQHANEHME